MQHLNCNITGSNTIMAISPRITCNGIKPSKSEVYALAAELVDTQEGLDSFKSAILEAFKSYDYYDYDYYNYYYNYYNNYYYYDYYNNDYYDYYNNHDYYDYYNYTKKEKVIALLFLSAMYAK